MDFSRYFTYDPSSGILTHKERPRSDFKTDHAHVIWNAQRAGREAGYKATFKDGRPKCIVVCIDRKRFKAHRVIWEMLNGPIPDGFIVDHENVDPWDNMPGNIRLATMAQNNQNRRKGSKPRSSALKGVSLSPSGKWIAQIKADGSRVILGRFDNEAEAHDAYRVAANKHFGEFARTA